MKYSGTAIAILALFAGGCAAGAEFHPAPMANVAPAGGAVATEAGVEIRAQGDAWDARPQNLDQELTPFLVEITNNSDQPLLIRYRSFRLVVPGTDRVAYALPPFDIEQEVTQSITPTYLYTGFTVAPYLSPYYPDLIVADPFLLDDPYYTAYTPTFREIDLPTGDMVELALPEGALAPGGSVTGFLYFQNVSAEVSRVRFVADLLNAITHVEFGEINIPFQVQ